MGTFAFMPDSKFLDKSEVQQDMMDRIKETEGEDGIIVAPCGCGKSAVIIESLLEAGTLGLVLCYESQGVYQIADAIRENTTLMDCQLFAYSGKVKEVPSGRFVYLVTTYGMFSTGGEHRSQRSRKVRDFMMSTEWDLICLDEFHHACAPTYKPMIQKLRAKRKLGFTATLYRSEFCGSKQLSHKNEEAAFGWFGRVLFRRRCKELEDAGLIAKIRRAAVRVELTPEFARAHAMAKGAQNIYLKALNPAKLNMLVAICAQHNAVGQAGIVFANHLLVAKVAKRYLGDRWEVLSGGAPHGEDEQHTPERNNRIVKRFNAGELDGMICTAVGESSMDVHLQTFCFVCVLDADGGIASAAQRLGRVARNERIKQEPGESDEQLATRRLAQQKEAVYYDLLTKDTADIEAAATRQLLFTAEGYTQEQELSYDAWLAMATNAGVRLPHVNDLAADMRLLKEVLMYSTLKEVAAEASAAAAAHNAPARAQVKNRQQLATDQAANKLMRARAAKQAEAAKAKLKTQLASSKIVKREHIQNQPMNAATRAVFRQLNLSASVQQAAGIDADLALASSDDDEEEEDLTSA